MVPRSPGDLTFGDVRFDDLDFVGYHSGVVRRDNRITGGLIIIIRLGLPFFVHGYGIPRWSGSHPRRQAADARVGGERIGLCPGQGLMDTPARAFKGDSTRRSRPRI